MITIGSRYLSKGVFCLGALVCLFVGVACGPPEVFEYTLANNGEEVVIDPDEFLIVRLPVDPSNFPWTIKFARKDMITPGEGYPVIETAEDGTQLEKFSFQSTGRSGQTPLQLHRIDPSNPDAEPTEKFRLSVWVR